MNRVKKMKSVSIERVSCAECGVLPHSMDAKKLKALHQSRGHVCIIFNQPRNSIPRGKTIKPKAVKAI